jgi:hypothetical protein
MNVYIIEKAQEYDAPSVMMSRTHVMTWMNTNPTIPSMRTGSMDTTLEFEKLHCSNSACKKRTKYGTIIRRGTTSNNSTQLNQ